MQHRHVLRDSRLIHQLIFVKREGGAGERVSFLLVWGFLNNGLLEWLGIYHL